MPNIVLVTGATGFVGSAVLRALARSGADLRALSRATSTCDNLDGVVCEIVVGDMRDADSMARAMAGVTRLYHVAADYRLWARDPNDILRANSAIKPAELWLAVKQQIKALRSVACAQ